MSAPRHAALVAAVATVALALVLVALVRSAERLVPAAVALLAAAYALRLASGGAAADTAAPLAGVALLAVAELTLEATALRGPALLDPRVGWRSAARLALLLVGSLLAGALVLAAAAIPLPGGATTVALGLAAAIAVMALVVRLAPRGGS